MAPNSPADRPSEPQTTETSRLHAVVDYEDSYVQPLLLSVLNAQLPPETLLLIKDASEVTQNCQLLQWRQYESVDFDHLMTNATTSIANSYIIRKALIRKHYLSATVNHWLTKNPESLLKKHVQSSIEFEVDYAEFLDDALLEAYELKESWARNASLDEDDPDREWWILKPGMSERGQGIRLFSSEEELTSIFEEWDPPSDDEDDDATSHDGKGDDSNGVMASHLRHFIAQPYVKQPLLMPDAHPSCNRKFHVRTYVVAVGALRVYVYRPMLALFAGESYFDPSTSATPNESLSSHLTNTCLQDGTREGSVHAFWSLPGEVSDKVGIDWKDEVFEQICLVTGEVFEAAARSMSIHFQPLPNAFEIFGLDFLVDATGNAWLLEVNAFPDFAQTGHELQDIIKTLFEGVTQVAIKPFMGIVEHSDGPWHPDMPRVLDIDLGRR
ncbi:Putative tubulin-tyrosine ligase/Tubulin polyglutamylase [Septoria linicola]|uniref:Tubulin-tyrosine ligase/Tubulin polyglutamylase n=1 Tax=Septoria linicola TaxID=215465 RepID=A0A9Q9B2S7_9PEZI|nr:putative tubulin-tyrosine ligase/Tubulin polyglutamylase [Septoria linicola]USW55301.1 Putative tubulin-tyrosine ligase/Tubulin polyglutamylase [Septoria linicola]